MDKPAFVYDPKKHTFMRALWQKRSPGPEYCNRGIPGWFIADRESVSVVRRMHLSVLHRTAHPPLFTEPDESPASTTKYLWMRLLKNTQSKSLEMSFF